MIALKILVFLAAFLSSGASEQKNITITGIAGNAKAGAVVLSNTKTYYVDGVASWDEKTLGKTIKVTGKLSVKYIKPIKPGEPQKQQITGYIRTILHPKWELVKKEQ